MMAKTTIAKVHKKCNTTILQEFTEHSVSQVSFNTPSGSLLYFLHIMTKSPCLY